jgi:PAS domain S-box-containing protein
MGAWFVSRRTRRQGGDETKQLKEVLELADCLLWQAKVSIATEPWKWSDFKLEPTALSRRLFAGRKPPQLAGLWVQLNVPDKPEMDERCRTALRTGKTGYDQQFRIILDDGRTTWLRESVSIASTGPDEFWLVGLVTDITAQREAELARLASEERLRQLLVRADCMLWQAHVTLDATDKFVWEWFVPKSELYRRIAGENTTLQRMPWDTTLVPEFAEIEARSRHAMLQGLPGYEQEFRVVLGQQVLWLHEQVTAQREGERKWRLEGVVIDITAQRQAEESKRASEAQLQHVLETADFLLWHAQVFQAADGELHWVLQVPSSTLYRRLFGRDPTDSGGLPWSELVSQPTFDEMTRRSHGAIVRGDGGYEQEMRGELNGAPCWLHEQATIRKVAPGEWQLVGIVTDVTSRRRAEEARQASERALREILERADCLLWRATVTRPNPAGPLEWVHFDLPASRLCAELLGERQTGETSQLWNPEIAPDLPEMNARSTAAILAGEASYEQEFRAKAGDRTLRLLERVTIFPVGPDEWHVVGVVTDITQRHEAQEAQRRSEARLEELLQRSDCQIWQGHVTTRPDGDFTWQLYIPRSRLHRRIFGCDPDGVGFRWQQVGVVEWEEMKRTTRTALLSGAPGYEQVFHIPNPAGDIWVSEQVTLSRSGPGEWDAVGVIIDITARREAEEARRTTEAQLRQILELADCLVWEASVVEAPDGRLDWKIYAPRSVLYRRLFGEDISGESLAWERLNVPEIDEMRARGTNAVREKAPGYVQEFRVVFHQRVVWLREVVTISPLGPGQSRLVGVITDITAQREAQEAQRASEAQLEQMLQSVDCLLWQARVFEVAPRKLHWVMFVPRSHLYRELFGADPGEPATLNWPLVVDPVTQGEIDHRAADVIFAGQPGYEQEFRAQRGERSFWLHEQVSITPVGPGEWRLVGVITDLTERRRAEQTVRASELRYRTLFQHMPVAIVEADFSEVGQRLQQMRASGVGDLASKLSAGPAELVELASQVRVVDWNEAARKLLRAKPDDFQRGCSLLKTPSGLDAIKRAILRLWDGHNTLETEIELRDFEGGRHDTDMRWWMERNDTGLDLRQSVMVFVDLTELKQAQAALAAEKERLAVTLRAMAEGVITTDVEGRVQFMNPAAAAFTRQNSEAVIGRPVSQICFFENDRTGEPIEVPVRRVALGDVVLELPSRTKLTVRDGVSRLVEGCCAPIHAANSEVIGTVLVFRDVTEHDRLEQELVRATKLESVGILAGGIAHDFNNILTAIMGNVALAGLDVDGSTDAGRALREAEKATLRARDLTQQLLTFAKGGEPVRTAVQLDGIVKEMTTFTLHGSRVKAIYDFPEKLWPADADKGQIGRVVQNLVLNAVQAMPEGGTIKITLKNERIDGLSRVALGPGDYVQIAIADTGIGIKPEHLSRIFDPYFTTKQMGSGLGLAAVYSIVNKHRGSVDVESQVGGGTTFRIWLPASRGIPDAAADGATVARGVSFKGRVLFMDDEESIRQMATFLLRRFGFDVVCATDGAEAVKRYREAWEADAPFALVIMDLTVPGGMGGREALTQLRQIDPKVRAIVSSGYSSDPVLANYREHGFCGVAAKPYELGDLARVLREAMADPRSEQGANI